MLICRWIITGMFLVAALTIGCSHSSTNETKGLPNDLEQTSVGDKADDSSQTLETFQVNEPLWSNTLRADICQAIQNKDKWAESIVETCIADFTMTVKEYSKSKVYAYLDTGKPITMEMWVDTYSEEKDLNWSTRLQRQMGGNFQMYWELFVAKSDLDKNSDFILEIADDCGTYGYCDWTEQKWEGRVRVVSFSDFPEQVQKWGHNALKNWEEEANSYAEPDDELCGADMGEDQQAEFILDGQVVGYAIEIWTYCPGSDGGYALFFFDLYGRTLHTKEDWF